MKRCFISYTGCPDLNINTQSAYSAHSHFAETLSLWSQTQPAGAPVLVVFFFPYKDSVRLSCILSSTVLFSQGVSEAILSVLYNIK